LLHIESDEPRPVNTGIHYIVAGVEHFKRRQDPNRMTAEIMIQNRNRLIGWTKIGLLSVLALLFQTHFARAQDADPPGRVGRVNIVEGQASVQLAGAEDWINEVLNRPLTTGDKLWVDTQSRAELQVGSSAVILGDQTGVQILNLDDRTTQLRLTAGSINVRVRSLGDGDNFEVDTPSVAVALLRPGEYRLDVNESGDVTDIAVIGGQAQVTGPTQSFTIDPRERGEFSGTDTVTAELGDMNGPDDLDLWAEQRDQRYTESQSARYVSSDVPGSEDLDENGSWENSADYGPLWQPRVVAVGWAPYQSGHWVWVSPWGWTWIDDARWGFAPFHYGRWVHLDRGWCWSPGRPSVRTFYAPALVAWIGGAARANVAWFPLGYNEVYRPAYRASNNYLRNVNVTNTYISNTTVINNTTINNTTINNATGNRTGAANPRYLNQNVPGAVSMVPHDAFVAARPVGRNLLHIDAHSVALATASTAAIAIAPTALSWARAPRAGAAPARRPERPVFARPVVTRMTPPPMVPLDAQRRSVIANGARPATLRAIPSAQTVPSAPIRVVSPNVTPHPISVIGSEPAVSDRARSVESPAPSAVTRPSFRNDRPSSVSPGESRAESAADAPSRDRQKPMREQQLQQQMQQQAVQRQPQAQQQAAQRQQQVQQEQARQEQQRAQQQAQQEAAQRRQPPPAALPAAPPTPRQVEPRHNEPNPGPRRSDDPPRNQR
jgi:flagellar biosynthesis GTPase FlhF